jgi:hypothetical protein
MYCYALHDIASLQNGMLRLIPIATELGTVSDARNLKSRFHKEYKSKITRSYEQEHGLQNEQHEHGQGKRKL